MQRRANWNYPTAVRFGAGRVAELPDAARVAGMRRPLVVTDLATAELVKQAANAFLATKISFINAMAEVCEVTGADVTRLAEALGHDGRIGGGREALFSWHGAAPCPPAPPDGR